MDELVFLVPFLLPRRDGRRQSRIDHHFDQIASSVWPGQKIAELQPIKPASRSPHRTTDIGLIYKDQHFRAGGWYRIFLLHGAFSSFNSQQSTLNPSLHPFIHQHHHSGTSVNLRIFLSHMCDPAKQIVESRRRVNQDLSGCFFLRLLDNDCGELHHLRRSLLRVLIQGRFKGQFSRSDL